MDAVHGTLQRTEREKRGRPGDAGEGGGGEGEAGVGGRGRWGGERRVAASRTLSISRFCSTGSLRTAAACTSASPSALTISSRRVSSSPSGIGGSTGAESESRACTDWRGPSAWLERVSLAAALLMAALDPRAKKPMNPPLLALVGVRDAPPAVIAFRAAVSAFFLMPFSHIERSSAWRRHDISNADCQEVGRRRALALTTMDTGL